MSIEVENLCFSYKKQRVLDNLSFSAKNGELVSIIGPNGTGKTTLFRCILGILSGYDGKILVDGKDSTKITPAELSRSIAYIPQLHYPSFNYSVLDMVLMGTGGQFSLAGSPGEKQLSAASSALEKLGISDLRERGFSYLSGGEQQLVLMARALVQSARTWILDEPTASLDFGNQMKVQTQLKKLASEGYSIIQSTHNPDQTFMFSDRIVALSGGKVVSEGTPSEVITEGLVKELYGLDVEINSLHEDKFRVCIPRELF